MAFHTLDFALFLVVALYISWGLARLKMFRLVFLLAASYVFYMSAKKVYIVLILGSTVVDYWCGIRIAATESKLTKKSFLAISLATNLGLLGTFKYYDFFVRSFQDGYNSVIGSFNGLFYDLGLLEVGTSLPLLNEASLPLLNVALPVGISFYTFQTMAYSIDVYRGQQAPIRNFVKFALFVSFFPQLVAGPIVLAKKLVPQFDKKPAVTSEMVSEGVFRILKGLIKKVAFADVLAVYLVDPVYATPGQYTAGAVTIALFAYSMQIYCDFSGYTDMAIGSAKLFGYELPENFDRPHSATDVSEFWRRWHMTLSQWIRSYLYFPLGGTYKGDRRAYVNIMIVLIVMGFWHGASWTFFWYGFLHGIVVCINRYTRVKRKRAGLVADWKGWQYLWRMLLTFTFVTFARVLFRAQTMNEATAVVERFFTFGWDEFWYGLTSLNFDVMGGTLSSYLSLEQIHWKIWLVLIISFSIHFSPARWVTRACDYFSQCPAVVQGAAVAAVCCMVVYFSSDLEVPFIYFQF